MRCRFPMDISDGFPGLYKQQRVGKNGKSFLLYKFRTMDALSSDDVHQEHYEKLSEKETIEPSLTPSKPIRIENDDRITNIGNFLRKTSLDELPNLINDLRGEMSIVGPRPLVQYESNLYGDYQKIIHILIAPEIFDSPFDMSFFFLNFNCPLELS